MSLPSVITQWLIYSENPELTFMHRLYRLVRKHDQPKGSTTRNIQRETNVKNTRIIVYKLLQVIVIHYVTTWTWEWMGFIGVSNFYCHTLKYTMTECGYTPTQH
jgi:hypothetical protein